MFCSECGAENPDTNRFCRNCGKPIGRQQPAAQQTVPPAPAPAAAPAPQPVPAAPPAPAPKGKRNWLGIVSIITGILSWGFLTIILGTVTVLLGIAALLLFRKTSGRISSAAIAGIVLGIAAIAVSLVFA